MQGALTSRDQLLRIGAWLVLVSEALMFIGLLSAHGGARPSPTLRELSLMGGIALALTFGCVAITAGLYHARAGRAALAAQRFAAVLALGTFALALQLLALALFTTMDPFGLVIFALHAAHVAAAAVFAAWAIALVRAGRLRGRASAAFQLVAAYWYFVAILWLFVGPLLTTR